MMFDWWMKNCVAVIALVLPATVVLLWISPAIHTAALCKADDPCIREWISALSGWVAAIVAAFTILPLYRQLAHQQRQTDFQLGDSQPSIELCRDSIGYSSGPIFRIVNWNRRQLIIDGLTVRSSGFSDADPHLKVGNATKTVDNGRIYSPIRVLGWEDRSKGPASVNIEVIRHIGMAAWADVGELPEKPMVRLELSGYFNDPNAPQVKIGMDVKFFDFVLM